MENEKKQQKPNGRRSIAIAIIAALVIIVVIILLLLLRQCDERPIDIGKVPGTGDYLNLTFNGKDYAYNGRITTICLTGLDTLEKIDDLENGEAKADMVMLLVLDEYNKKMSVISLNRDTLLKSKTEGETLKLLDAYRGGENAQARCENVLDAVSEIICGIPITYYYTMNLSATPFMHGLVNEFEITVPNDNLAETYPEFTKGSVIKLDATNVNAFLRGISPVSAEGNLERMERHKAYMEGFLKMALDTANTSNLQNIQDAAEQCAESEYVKTNIVKAKYVDLINALKQMNYEEINFYTPEGEYKNVDGVDQFTVDEDKLLENLVKIFYLEK